MSVVALRLVLYTTCSWTNAHLLGICLSLINSRSTWYVAPTCAAMRDIITPPDLVVREIVTDHCG